MPGGGGGEMVLPPSRGEGGSRGPSALVAEDGGGPMFRVGDVMLHSLPSTVPLPTLCPRIPRCRRTHRGRGRAQGPGDAHRGRGRAQGPGDAHRGRGRHMARGPGGRAQGPGDTHRTRTGPGGRAQGPGDAGDAHRNWGTRTGAGGRAQGPGDAHRGRDPRQRRMQHLLKHRSCLILGWRHFIVACAKGDAQLVRLHLHFLLEHAHPLGDPKHKREDTHPIPSLSADITVSGGTSKQTNIHIIIINHKQTLKVVAAY